MATDAVTDALNSAKDTLAKANRFTESVEGNPTSAFAPKKPEAPKIPQMHKPSYSLAQQARSLTSDQKSTAEGLKSRQENVQEYLRTNPQ